MNNTDSVTNYDHNGAVMYTVITLLFYSLSLFCSLILNIDRHDHFSERNWNAYHPDRNKKIVRTSQMDVLNILSDQSIRQKYWRIYYGDDEFECRSHKFVSAELKRLSIVSQRMKQLNNERTKQSSRHQELDELNRIVMHNSQTLLPAQSPSSFLSKFRRARSTSIAAISYSNEHRTYDVLCQTPLCKPSNIDLTENP